MAEETNVLVNSDNENGTQSATWTPVEQVDPDQKVLVGKMDPLSGNMVASWDNVPTGPSADKQKTDITIYDYDGTIIAGYTAEDFANLEAFPVQPAHENLTGRGYNYTLSAAKAYVAEYGKLDLGAQYEVTDGKTRLYIRLEAGRLKPTLTIILNGTAIVDWGDNSDMVTLTGNNDEAYSEHAYAAAGDYVISIAVTGTLDFPGMSSNGSKLLSNARDFGNSSYVYKNALRKIEIGAGVTSILDYSFNGCGMVEAIIIPPAVTSIGKYAFVSCGLKSIVIPSEVTDLGQYAFHSCFSLQSVALPPDIGRGIETSTFYDCRSLISMTIPTSVEYIDDDAFNSCWALTSVVIPSDVDSVGNNAFYGCGALKDAALPIEYLYTIGEQAFQSCFGISSVIIPPEVTTISNGAFAYCSSIASVDIPLGVTTIEDNTFASCVSLASITIPSEVSSIGREAFYGCYGLGFIKFEASTPATAGADAFKYLPTDCIIYVPTGSLSAYTSAANYPDSNTYTYVEY